MEVNQEETASCDFMFPLMVPDDGETNNSTASDEGSTRAIKTTELWFRDFNIDHSKPTFLDIAGQRNEGLRSRHSVDEIPRFIYVSENGRPLSTDVPNGLKCPEIKAKRKGRNILTKSGILAEKCFQKSSNDYEEAYCMFTGFCAVPDSSDIIVCDNKSQTITLINDQFIPIQKCITLYEPWDVAVVDTNLMIVSFPFVRMIQYFKFRWNNTIVPWYPFISGNEYYGIAYDRGHVIATCMHDENQTAPSVHVMDKKGNLQHVIKYDQDGNNLFVEPKFIDVDKTCRMIYVLDLSDKSIVKFDRAGEQVHKVATICNDPSGITVNSADGTIMVCNRFPPAILNLNNDLEPLQVFKARSDTSWTPLSIQYNELQNKLFVTMRKSSLIRIFEW